MGAIEHRGGFVKLQFVEFIVNGFEETKLSLVSNVILPEGAIFVIVNIWFLYFVIIDKPKESLIGLLTLIVGTAVYFLTNKFSKNEN